MKEILFVKPEEAERARKLEQVVLSLPKESGILFVGALPILGAEKTDYYLNIGCSRDINIRTIDFLVRNVLQNEIPEGSILRIELHYGISR